MESPSPSGRPARGHRHWLQLGFALVAAPVTLAGALTLVAFLIAGASEADRAGTIAVTQNAAMTFLVALTAFSLTFGLAGAALLGSLRRRRLRDWLAAGALAGLLVAVGRGLAGGGVVPLHLIVAAGLGIALFALIRWFAGVRGR